MSEKNGKHAKRLQVQRAILCAKYGHPRIANFCFGYVTCARCGAHLGDTLAGVFDRSSYVIVGHDCKKCRANTKTLKRHEKFLLPDEAKLAIGVLV